MMKSLCAILGCRRRTVETPLTSSTRKSSGSIFSFGPAFAAVFLVCTTSFLPAQPANKPLPADLVERAGKKYGFSPAEEAELKTKGEISRFSKELGETLLLPDARIRNAILDRLRTIKPSVVAEALFLLPLSSKERKKDVLDLHIFNTLRSIKTMKGIEYYSASRERMRIMFHDAYAIADPDSRTPLPDPLEKHILPESLIYVYQHDSSFGKNAFETRYVKQGQYFQLSMKNLTEMYYGIVPLVEPERLLLDLAILPAEDHLLFYGCIGVKTYSLFGLENRINDSFTNRIKALYGWFSREFSRGEGG